MFKKPEFSIHNVKPQRKNQDSADRMDNMFSKDLFAYIANTYGTSFTQSHSALQLSKVFYKSALFYAKQSQFSKKSNGYKVNYNKGL